MAHIPDGFLSAPVIIGTAVASAGTLALAAHRSRRRHEEREALVLGAATAFVFAAQMLNFPLGAGTSAHLLGGVLVGAVVGPWSGMLVMFAVLLVQALLFQDGGISALGANTLNVAVIGVGVGFCVYRWLLALWGDGVRRRVTAASVAAFVSTGLVGVAVAIELALSGTVPFTPAVVAVGGGHLVVGVAEAVLTGAILGMLMRSRPELVTAAAPSSGMRRWAVGTVVVSAALAVSAAYLASAKPDALEAAASYLGLGASGPVSRSAPFAEYTTPLGGPWFAALIGVVVVFAVIWIVVKLNRAGRRP